MTGYRSLLLSVMTLLSFGSLLRPGAAAPFPVPILDAPQHPLAVYHLGHSLVGPIMPHMLSQLSPEGHSWNSQLGSGTTLQAHWESDIPILDFDVANTEPAYRDAHTAISSGEYDAVVLTEMVELRDAIKYFGSAKYLRRWANLARNAPRPPRIYLYETWHNLDDPEGWLQRIDTDLEQLWLGRVLGSDTRRNPETPVYLIPAGQVMAAVVRAAERGELAGVSSRSDLFRDMIHLNDLGAYVVALTHFAVLYHRSPEGLPHRLTLPDGSPAQAFQDDTARRIQQIVWQVVRGFPRTGLAQTEAAQ